ncbi:MAG TPA: hypothetical protein VIP46_18300 [Pyrinomonadaceae bacterium]
MPTRAPRALPALVIICALCGAAARAQSLGLDRSRGHTRLVGADTVVFYGVSVTDADIVMRDGKSLEKTGVKPDEVILPTARGMAAGHDPVLAYAASLVGLALDPAKSGSFFPVEWKR